MKEMAPRVQPNAYHYSSLIAVCSANHMLPRALALIEELQELAKSRSDCQPTLITYQNIISGCSQPQTLDVGLRLYHQMQDTSGLQADGLIYQFRSSIL
jgi:hypothetical protein